jgi:hypothetical protein
MDWSVILSSTIVAGTTIIGILLKEYLQKNKTKKIFVLLSIPKKIKIYKQQ